jgi:Mg2+ and Co2+ transporter CorA
MMVFLLGDTINRYSMTIDSLSGDFSRIAQKVAKKKRDDSILGDAVTAGRKIDAIHETILRQRQVLKDLLSINQFHQSEFVPAADIEKHLEALDHHLTVLDHYQERKNGLIELYRAKVSNELDEVMKRLGAISAMITPAAIIGGLMGMNVALPGAALPYAFWLEPTHKLPKVSDSEIFLRAGPW